MGRPNRAAAGGWIYHVLNRANARSPIFLSPEDFEAFARVLEEAVARTGIRLLSDCVMGNHWHLVVWTEKDGLLAKFVGWLSAPSSVCGMIGCGERTEWIGPPRMGLVTFFYPLTQAGLAWADMGSPHSGLKTIFDVL